MLELCQSLLCAGSSAQRVGVDLRRFDDQRNQQETCHGEERHEGNSRNRERDAFFPLCGEGS